MKKIIIASAVLVALAVITAGWIVVMTPPLSIENRQGIVVAHIETLGEYPTTVRRIRIEEADTDAVVFDAVARSDDKVKIWNIELRPGANPTGLLAEQSDGYHVVVPHSSQFVLRRNCRYRISVWGAGWPPSRAKFVMAR